MKKKRPYMLSFKNSQGLIVKLRSDTTIDQLTKAGIRVDMQPLENPKNPDPRIYYHPN